MIKYDNGVFEAKGTEVELLSDLCTIIRDVREALAKNHGEQRADKMLGELVKVAFMTDGGKRREVRRKNGNERTL